MAVGTSARFRLLSSYPKSGNTWLRIVLESLQTGQGEIDINANPCGVLAAADRTTFDRVMGIKASDLMPMEIAWARPRMWDLVAAIGPCPSWIKMHDAFLPPWPDFDPPIGLADIEAVIYVVRDPRDVAVSCAHHFGVDIDSVVAWMAAPDAFLDSSTGWLPEQLPQFLASWSRHVESWLDTPGLRIHVVRYEDMHAAPEGVFAEIARFLKIPCEPQSMIKAVAAGRFHVLRGQEDRSGFVEREPGAVRFFRRGVVGGWRDELNAEQAARIVSDHGHVMERLGYAV